MPNIGPLELIVLLVIVLLVFGPKRLPGLGKQLGGGMREFKDSLSARHDRDDDDEDDAPRLTPGTKAAPSSGMPAEDVDAAPAPAKSPDAGA